MIKKPPAWKDHLKADLLHKSLSDEKIKTLIEKSNREYLYWDTLRHHPVPKGFKSEEIWSLVKFSRLSLYEKTPIKSNDGGEFVVAMTKTLWQRLNYIDINSAGFIRTLGDEPTHSQNNKLMMNSLTEEAIATSQIEGANTSRKVAKDMISSSRKPRTKGEQMIINSYKLMQQIEVLKKIDLTEDLLIEIQKIITNQTLSEEDGRGRLRIDGDQIVVLDPITGETVHEPMSEKSMKRELGRLIDFANNDSEDDFMHPVVKATMLHFWIAYLHPFVDGNGRTARAIFYWYLQKKGYWLVKYISISRAIASSRAQYDKAFLESEMDEGDLTYFILYITKSFETSIKFFLGYLEKKSQESDDIEKMVDKLSIFNEREVSLIRYFKDNPGEHVDVTTHKNKHLVSRSTAHNDLVFLEKNGLITGMKKSRKNVFVPNISIINKLLSK